ncbi:MAG: hypothetical protein U5L74_07260 [Ideonella sp.]|nr:hypothetical protein [Ideonella sp.]
MTFRALIGMGLIAIAGLSQAQSTPIEQWQIIEGKGLTDDYVFIGMTRKLANTRTANGNCKGKVTECTFRAQDNPIGPSITLHFSPKNRVTRFDIVQRNGIAWQTTAGVIEGMTPEQVQALYPGSTIQQTGQTTQVVMARNQGYSYSYEKVCNSDDFCDVNIFHSIFKRRKSQ